MNRRFPDRFRLANPAREALLLSTTAWLSALLFALSQIQLAVVVDGAIWSTCYFWSLASIVGMASSLGLSEMRQRRNLAELKTLREAAWTDSLTGAVNRRAADAEMKRRLAQFRRRATPIAILLIDVDYFKSINDQWGHNAGDEVLKHITKVITATVREMDLVARFGGEEFIAILADTNLRQAARAAERVRKEIEASAVVLDGEEIRFTISIGLTSAVKHDDPERMLKRADAALYTAKRNGRNRVYACSSEAMICSDVSSRFEAEASEAQTPDSVDTEPKTEPME